MSLTCPIIYFKLKYKIKTDKEHLNRPWKFIDLEPDDKKDLNITIASYEDPSFETKFIEIDTGVQVNKLKIVKIN